MRSTINGTFDSFENGVARGWAFDAADPAQTVTLHVVIDRQEVGTVSCHINRDDIRQALHHPTGAVGFEYRVPPSFADGRPHEISFRLPTREAIAVHDPAAPGQPGAKLGFTIQPHVVRSYVEGLHHDKLRGWAVKRFHDGHWEGGCAVRVTADGREIALVRANRNRRDVAALLGCDPNCGFEVTIPAAVSRARRHTFRFHVVPDEVELNNSPVTTSLTDDALVGIIAELSDKTASLFQDFVELRKKIDALMPTPGWSLRNYGAWARQYYPALRRRVEASRHPADPAPAVSIVLEAGPHLDAAVQSVLGQTYAGWELVIAGPAGASREMTAAIAAACKRDPRIRKAPARRSSVLDVTSGEWIVLLGQDSVLVDVALEVMVRAALHTGADFLYPDEDSIDPAGYFSDPVLKPDWNHRYALAHDYVGQVSLLRRARLAELGGLDPRPGGARQLELLLRLSETAGPAGIHHVPEILHHRRSTADVPGNAATPDDAAEAKRRVVQDHLDRLDRAATVTMVDDSRRRIDWHPGWHPDVCVIVPFREQVDITRRCVDALLARSSYDRLGILLVDNWSTSPEAAAFCREMERHEAVRVMRVEETFNFSRLNNLAASATQAEVLCFMNNDLLVDPGWLHAALGELADPAVGAVGGRFRYPDGTLQHASVVVGPAGIAAHGHLGAEEGEYGYIGQIVLSREVTAVTAAGMLVRHAVFDQVGGLDETAFPVAFNDVDLCLRIREAGHRIIYCAEWTAEHHESLSRGSDDRPEHERRFFYETERMRERWSGHALFDRDPAYSRFLTVDRRPYHDLQAPDAPPDAS